MKHVYASIDLGSDTIKLAVCELYLGHLNLLAAVSMPSQGIKRGLIVDPELAKNSIMNAVDEVQDMLGVKIEKVIATVPSHNADYKIVKAMVQPEGDLITNKDMMRAYKAGIKQGLLPNEEFVTVVPIDFRINEKTIMKDPKGFPAKTLLGRAMMVTTPKKNVYSVASVIESLGIELSDISVGSESDISIFRNDNIDKSIGVVVNLGAEITSVSLYSKSIPVRTKIIGAGGKDIDEEIAYTYHISLKEARRVKETFALAHTRNAGVNDVYETLDAQGKRIMISQKDVSQIVLDRLNGILELVKKEIDDLTSKPIQYIIVTGGMSNMLDIEYCLRDNFGSLASKGKVKLIGVRNNKYSTVIGNIIYFLNTLKLKGLDYSMLSEDEMDRVSSPEKDIPDSVNGTMLGKLFGYFFGE